MTASAKVLVPFEVAGPTGAVAATRYAGGTASGAPASGSFLKGDFVIDQTGKVWICTASGSPGTWADAAGTPGVPTTRTITAGSGLSGGGDLSSDRTIDANVDNSTIEVDSDALRVKPSGITSNEIATDAVGADELAPSGVTAGSYGDSTHVPVLDIDDDGRVTSASEVATSGGGGSDQRILLADGHGTPFTFNDMLQRDDGTDFMWSDP